jgi:lysophospholipase L1-like esterase
MSATSPTPRPADDAPLDGDTQRALRRMAMALLTVVALSLVPYLVPGLQRLRPWVPGEDAPLVHLFQEWNAQLPTFAGAGDGYQSPQRPSARLADELGGSVAANLGDDAPVAPAPPAPPAPDGAQEGSPAPPAVRVEPREYDGIEVEIHDPGHRGMAPFYAALLQTAQEKPGALTRVTHYGDSSIATDLITHTVRRRLQGRFGDGGHGFLLVARGHMPWGHRDVGHQASDDWELREMVRGALRDGRYGYGGVQYRGRPGASARFSTAEDAPVGERVSRFELYYQRSKRGGRVRLQVAGDDPKDLDTRSKATEDAFEVVTVPDGAHELHLRVLSGQPVLYGMVMERDGPGVVYDSLGMVGARARRMLNFDADHIRGQLDHRSTDLLILGFGGNEADDPPARIAQSYEDEFVKVLRHMRAGREGMGCLVFGPLDQARRDERGRIATIPTVPKIVEAQRKAAEREGCAFYDTFAAMGGEGAMQRWYRSRPRLALGDFRHATPAGYEVIGNMFYKAILKGFSEYLEGQRQARQPERGRQPDRKAERR